MTDDHWFGVLLFVIGVAALLGITLWALVT